MHNGYMNHDDGDDLRHTGPPAMAHYIEHRVPARVTVTPDGCLSIGYDVERDGEIIHETETIPATWEEVETWLS